MAYSIIIPTYKKGDLLRQVLNSLENQINDKTEVIVIDDGGHDQGIIQQFSFVNRIERKHKEYQLASNINVGIKASTNDHIIKIDADCVPQEEWFNNLTPLIQQDRLVCGRVEWEEEGEEIRKDSRFNYSKKKPDVDEDNFPQRTWGGCLAFTRKDVKEVGYFSEAYDGSWGSEESDFGWKFHYASKNIYFCFDALVKHLFHGDQDYKKQDEIHENYKLLKERKKEYQSTTEPGGCLPK